ncbi:dienelactone hydrolase family protein [Metapseudomonas furukawaii]|jgi:dienelactone hydrolase|uniref:Dienelactone hydrolase family protein n=1 Tax=Metapseudomonas furukawaii TaxID=1149133 RepID=A0AAD1FGE2_METFU|nr:MULTISPECIES: dienelactone hydrolase family protein [Pseudomonas]ELS28483.1 dienelactone hydrolase family protein [Pseudomonas furukawaii]OWJ91510.1 dienelactone hydrolase [Pseudomonas sp. A46]WAG77104.1 dienelactone hydrolase family protein [Pseudomonas furukawaii]BAU75072.1 dienelactone hydrolase family protein [Pseudomonas furukawaii]
MNRSLLCTLLLAVASPGWAAMVTQPVAYELDGKAFEGILVYDDAVTAPRPGLLMVPNWLGVTPAAAEQAKLIAGQRYVILVADMYGKDVRPANPEEARAAATAVRADRPLMRKRAAAGVEALKAQAGKVPLDPARLGAIGFCFGGGSVLELARAGSPLKGFVSFHGNLDTPNPEDARNIRAPVLVLHGADDPAVPKEQVDGFIAEMTAAKADWQLVSYGGAVHSFTDPDAKVPGRNEYHPKVAARSYQAMNDLFDEVFDPAR